MKILACLESYSSVSRSDATRTQDFEFENQGWFGFFWTGGDQLHSRLMFCRSVEVIWSPHQCDEFASWWDYFCPIDDARYGPIGKRSVITPGDLLLDSLFSGRFFRACQNARTLLSSFEVQQ
jgi:hypothetical protein